MTQNKAPEQGGEKELTPMAAHIEWLDERYKYLVSIGSSYLADEVREAIDHAASLLEAERKNIIDAYNSAYGGDSNNDGDRYFNYKYIQ